MPRYLIVRRWDADADLDVTLPRAIEATAKLEGVEWEHSHVGMDGDDALSFCVYRAPNPEVLRTHAQMIGEHRIDELYEIGGDISPADFPD